MSAFLRFLAVVFCMMLVPATVIVVFLQPAGTRLVRAELYKDVLRDREIYSRFPALVGDAVEETRRAGRLRATNSGDGSTSQVLDQLTAEDWTILIGAVIPPQLLQREIERGLDESFAFLREGGGNAGGPVSLVEIKQRMTGAEGAGAYRQLLASKPECSAQEFDAAYGLPVACRPPTDRMDEAVERFSAVMQAAAETLPDQIDPWKQLRQLDGPEGQAEAVAAVRKRVRQFEWVARWSPVVPVALAFLVAVCAVRSFRGLLGWWGIPALLSGGAAAIVAIPFVLMGPAIVQAIAVADLPADAPVETMQAVMGIFTGVFRALMYPALKTAAVLVAAGVLALILAACLRPKQPAAPATPPPLS